MSLVRNRLGRLERLYEARRDTMPPLTLEQRKGRLLELFRQGERRRAAACRRQGRTVPPSLLPRLEVMSAPECVEMIRQWWLSRWAWPMTYYKR